MLLLLLLLLMLLLLVLLLLVLLLMLVLLVLLLLVLLVLVLVLVLLVLLPPPTPPKVVAAPVHCRHIGAVLPSLRNRNARRLRHSPTLPAGRTSPVCPQTITNRGDQGHLVRG